jgi:O-antigen/teichoic acid export membrane protein
MGSKIMQQGKSIKSNTFSGLLWSFTDLIANKGINLIVQIFLARLLLPEHFGLIGMITIFIAISNSIVDSGFFQALIREQKSTQRDYSTVFYFNLAISIIIYLILFFSSNIISDFYNEPKLEIIIKLISTIIVINAFAIIQRVILNKTLNFKIMTKVNMIAGISSGIIALIGAMLGFGVWSLVILQLSMSLLSTFLLWINIKWIPSLVFSGESFKRLYSFGYKLLLSGLIDTIYNNIYYVIIGRLYSTVQLGYYTQAVKFRDIASQTVTNSIQRVTYPALSSMQDDNDKLTHGYRKVIKTTTFLYFPFIVGLMIIAPIIITLLLGERWIKAIPYFQLLCVVGMLYPINSINLNILKVKGRSDLFLLLEVIKKGMLTVLLVLAVWLDTGIMGLITAAIINSPFALLVNTHYTAREISYTRRQQFMDLMPTLLISLLMGIVIYYSGQVLPKVLILKLILQILIGVIVYISLCKVFRIKELDQVYKLIRNNLIRK